MKELKFCPNIDDIENIEFRSSMIESAYDYFMICTTSPHQRMSIQTVLCALAIEIILKSFHATVSANEGKINENYEFNRKNFLPQKADAHDLVDLYKSLPCNLQRYLFDDSDVEVLAENKNIFTTGRYLYEKTANTVHFDCVITLAASLICKVVYLYKSLGCKDPFILHLDVNELYFSRVQQFVWS